MISTAANEPTKEEPPDAYTVLGLQREVDENTLVSVYKDLAKQWHPDRHQGTGREEAEARFQAISEAFQILKNPDARKQYDKELDAAKTAADKAELAKKYRAATWNTQIPDLQVQAACDKRLSRMQHVCAYRAPNCLNGCVSKGCFRRLPLTD